MIWLCKCGVFLKLSQVAHFYGPRNVFLLLSGVFWSLSLSAVEILVTIVLQLFLISIGMLAGGSSLLPSYLIKFATLQNACFGLLLIAGFKALCQFFISQNSANLLESVSERLRVRALRFLLMQTDGVTLPSSRIHFLISEVFPKSSLFSFFLCQTVAAVIQAFCIVVYLLIKSPRESLIGIFMLALVGLLVLILNKKIRSLSFSLPAQQEQLSKGIERVTKNWLLVRMLRTQRDEFDRLTKNVKVYADHAILISKLANFGGALPAFLGIAVLVVVIYFSQAVFKTPAIQLVSFLYLFMRLVQNLSTSTNLVAALTSNFVQFKSAFDFFNESDVDGLINSENQVLKSSKGQRHEAVTISLRDISFGFSRSEKPLFSQFDLEITKGSQLLLVGRSGLGKSTLLSIIAGVQKVGTGKVLSDGRELTEVFDSGEARVGYAGSEPFLHAGTIRENLSYGFAPPLSDDECWEALSIAVADEFVKVLPGELEFSLMDNESRLSAGQKQRLCIARAVARKPSLIILDEAFANLDFKTSSEVYQSVCMLKGESTCVIVTHANDLVQNADQCLDLNKR